MENLYRVSLIVSALLKLEETEGKIIVETNVPGKYASCRHPLSASPFIPIPALFTVIGSPTGF